MRVKQTSPSLFLVLSIIPNPDNSKSKDTNPQHSPTGNTEDRPNQSKTPSGYWNDKNGCPVGTEPGKRDRGTPNTNKTPDKRAE